MKVIKRAINRTLICPNGPNQPKSAQISDLFHKKGQPQDFNRSTLGKHAVFHVEIQKGKRKFEI